MTADKVTFAEKGQISNGYKASIGFAEFGDEGLLINVGQNFVWEEDTDGDGILENKAGLLMDTFANFQASEILMGKNSRISNEMGTTFSAGVIKMGDGATIANGADYELKYPGKISLTTTKKTTVTIEQPDGTTTEEETVESTTNDYLLNEVPHASSFHADEIYLGNDSTVLNRKDSSFTGEKVVFGDNGTFDIQSGAVVLTSDATDTSGEGASLISMGKDSTLNVLTEYQEEVTQPTVTENDKGEWEIDEEVILTERVYRGSLSVDNIVMGENSTINNIGGLIQTDTIKMADNANIYLDSAVHTIGDTEVIFTGELEAATAVLLGNKSTIYVGAGRIETPLINFLDDGSFISASSFTVNRLNMGDRATIQVAGVLNSNVTVGSDSNVYILDPIAPENLPDCKHCYAGGGINGGLEKVEGAKNVHVVVRNDDYRFYTQLNGKINVDSILLESGLLEVSGDIKGNITLNSDTILRLRYLEGMGLYIHDPVVRAQGSTNTTIEVAFPDKKFYQTTSWLSAENLVVSNGGIEVNNPVDFDNVFLGADATVRLTGNYKIGSVKEVNNDSVNTTLEIAAGKGNSINSTGSIHTDRILISSGNYNVFHDIYSLTSSGPVTLPATPIEGIEIGTDASMTTFANVSVNKVVRNQEAIKSGADVSNTSLIVNADHFQVLRDVDVDNLVTNGGVFEFLNKDGDNVVNVTNDIQLKPYAALAGAGVLNVKSGHLALNENARLAVSMQNLETQPISELRILSSDSVITNPIDTSSYTTKDVLVETDSSGYIDVRADAEKNDKITVDGTVNLADGTRVLVRNIQTNQEYEILSAFQLNGNSDKLRTTFLWTGVEKKIDNNKLSISVQGVHTLQEGIKIADHSKNVDELADTLTRIRQSEGAYSIDPFLDSVFFAESAEEAVRVMDEYSPEGYLNTMQASLRMQKAFKDSVLGEMNAMRNYRIKQQTTRYYVKNPYYYGRPGYEKYYYGFKENRRNPYQERRSDRGGIWAKPFMMNLSQDDKDNQSGFDLSAYGFTAGIDRKVGVFTLGLAALYASGDMEQNNKNMKSDLTTYGLGVYGSITPHYSRSFMDFYALWSQTSVDSKRSISALSQSAKAGFDLTAVTLGADVGYEILVAPNFIVTPKIGLDYTSVKMDDVVENGGGRAKVLLKGADLTSIQMPVEIKAALDLGSHNYRFRPEVHARWTHEFGDTAAKSTATFVRYAAPFAVEGLNVDKDVFTVGGSLLWIYGLSEFELKYDYDFSSTSTGHSINMGYKYLF